MKKNVEILQVNSGNFLRLLSLTIILAFIMPVITNAQTGKANFAGSWTYNAAKSTLPQGAGGGGGRGGFGGGDFSAKQDANLLSVTRTRPNQDGENVTTTTTYTLDGKESVNKSAMGESKSIAKWSADGKTLNISTTASFTFNGETREMKSSESWALTDPNTLSITSTRATQDGDVKTTRVYNKK